ncbi:tetratricopeptide repeat protein [Actinoplanes solisilvae]|uniref:tetratricopeptide repeat protein n=1 Tax=Actinoplanes solisilvae TaxID=2486853 RepID=UPI000FD732B2|nr:tetratricopeptide repeat protein [Actinoplanes solisilvae]
MNSAGRWTIASVLSAGFAAAAWTVAAFQFDLDTETAATVAALGAALIGAPAAAWASGEKRGPGPEPAGARRRPVVLGALPRLADAYQRRAFDEAFADGRVVVLTGLGGVGKTQLAAGHAVEALGGGAVDVLVWVDAAERDSVVSGLAAAARELTGVVDSDQQRGAVRLIEWTRRSARWLVVLDNVTSPDDLRGLWPSPAPSGRIVVTSRRRDAVLTENQRVVIDVDVFTVDEAVSYLRAKLPAGICADPAALAADLGNLPLALAQAAAYMSDRGIDCDTYRRRFADSRRQLTRLFPKDAGPSDDYASTVTATWSLSVGLADTLDPLGVASPLLNLLAFLAPTGVPQPLLTDRAVLAYVSAHRTAGEGPVDADDAGDALRCLHRLSLATVDERADPPQVSAHRLLQRVVREALDPAGRREAVLAAAEALLDIWPAPERSITYSRVLRANATALIGSGADFLWEGSASPLFARLGVSIGSTGDEAGAAAHFRALAAEAGRRLGPEHRDTFRFLERMIFWLGEAGDAAAALEAARDLAARTTAALGDDDPLTLDAELAVARWLGESGDPAGAVAAYDRVLPRCTRRLGADHPDVLRARSWHAFMQGEAGNHDTAARLFDDLVRDRTRVLGADHRDTLAARHLSARWHGLAGSYDSAAEAASALVSDALRVLGPDHPDTLHFRHTLARFRGFAGDPRRAASAFEGILADRVRVLGPEHLYTLASRYQLARWRYQAGEHARATAEMAELAGERARVLGPAHPLTLQADGVLRFWRGELDELPPAVTARSDS